ncbi:isoaspartyl peptidase/L-asparaginase family protein [Bowmanella denitrificans]|uniref:isoaspartyl peptidase/L-asparaginase family protein n=1 Tax=Bowmanella denitrificans TaxID=366582 RepID=UPI000C9B1B47|nr:isoaspartyl peptidase/L-asparaginase [Bowmanella denitrificans]
MKRNLAILLSLTAMTLSTQAQDHSPIAIAIHGGAGTISKAQLTPEREQQYRAKLEEAVTAGYALLQNGASSLDAVVASVQILEDSPLFNAGRGSVYTYNGEHELDASIMEGKTRAAGAVAGVKTVKSPIALARAVMEKSHHVILSGQGAEDFADTQGLEKVENSYFDSDARRQQLDKAKETLKQDKTAFSRPDMLDYKFGTVGAVALDKQGNLAAATSTGGMTAKRWGRIGDSPIIGAGTFADNQSCAVSSTGHGEYFIRYNVAADICARSQYLNIPAKVAAQSVIHNVLKNAGGSGGVILVDNQGEISMPFNTQGMYRASVDVNGKVQVAIFADESAQ